MNDVERRAVEALARGERERVTRILMDSYGADVFRYCASFLGDETLAADVQQETFVQAFRDLGRFRGRSTFKTWLIGIARHRALDAVKKERRHQRGRHDEAELSNVHDAAGTAEERMADASAHQVLRKCLGRLNARVRDAVLLRYHEEISYPEISRLTGDRAPTLQARVARALPVLKRCLEEHGVTL